MVLWGFVKHWDIPIVKANNWGLSYVLLISLLLHFLCCLPFIAQPNKATCTLRQFTFGAMFTVAVSAKTLTVILVFKARKPGGTMRKQLVTGASNNVIPMCSLIRVIVCEVWLGTSPPFLDMDTPSEPKELFIMCNKASVTAFYWVLGYPDPLALGTFSLGFPGQDPTWHLQWSHIVDLQHAGVLQCLGHLPPCLAPRARSWWPWRSSPCWPPVPGPRPHLCPRGLHYPPETREEHFERFKEFKFPGK